MCGNDACRNWFKNIIIAEFSSAYPEADKIESGPKEENRLFKKFEYDKMGSLHAVLIRAIEVGDITFLEFAAKDKSNSSSSSSAQFFTPSESLLLEILKKDNQGVFYPESAGLFQMAVANKDQKIAAYLISKGAKINPEKPNRTHPLVFAILNNDEAMIDFLLENGADIHYSDRKKYTSLMLAVMQQNVPLIKKLLQKGARIDDVTIDGDTVFHLLAAKNNSAIFEILSQAKNAELAINHKNIYGFTPNDIQTKLANDTMPPTINQTKIAHIMHYYLRSQYRDTTFFPGGPHCNGVAFTYLVRSCFESPQYYFATETLFAKWDGKTTEDSLIFKNFDSNLQIDENLKKIYKKYKYKNLADVIEQWITDIACFQKNGNIPGSGSYMQWDRKEQYTEHANLHDAASKEQQPLFLLFENWTFGDTGSMDLLYYPRKLEQYIEILKYLSRMPKSLCIGFHGSQHTTGAILDDAQKFKHCDPNHKYETVPESAEELAQDIIHYKYIRTKSAPDEMGCPIQIFYTQKNSMKSILIRALF